MSEKPIKLTAPQVNLLLSIQKMGSRYVGPNYPPLKTLLLHNFVQVAKSRGYFELTEAGKEYLK